MFAKFSKKSTPIDPKQAQSDRLAQIGAFLCQIRTERDIALQLVESKTQIPIRLLKAIEKGDIQSLPEPVYIRGLIRQFADSLGLNGVEIANSFPIDTSKKKSRFALNFSLPSVQLRPVHLYFLYIFLVILSVRGISNILKQSVPSIAISPQTPPVAKPTTTATTTKTKTAKPTATAKKPAVKPVVVNLQFSDLSWVEIVADGKSIFQGNVPKGTQKTWSADKQIVIRTGNAGGVSVKFNDGQAKTLGKLGQIETVIYKAEPNSSKSQKTTSGT
jgi:cytoskeletal protein RodZ